jgi:hypothetical protein
MWIFQSFASNFLEDFHKAAIEFELDFLLVGRRTPKEESHEPYRKNAPIY